MATPIGEVLRKTRRRRKIELSQVEAATRIRVRYLRAIEDEDWDVLPGDVYARGFIRTYASYLGLDGQRLAGEYRRGSGEEGGNGAQRPEVPLPVARARRGIRVPSGAWGVLVTLGVVALLVALALAGGDGDSIPTPARKNAQQGAGGSSPTPAASRPGHALRLAATAEVWVCLLDAEGKPLVDGQILEAGAEEGPFRSGSFTVAFGNGEVSMTIDGREADIPPSSSPVGYTVEPGGNLRPLAEGERPTCT